MKEKETRISPGGIKQGRTKGTKKWIRLCIIEGCPNDARDSKTKKCIHVVIKDYLLEQGFHTVTQRTGKSTEQKMV